MFHVKICGVRHPSDIEAVAMAGADAIGLNFFPPSVRYVDPEDGKTAQLSKTAADRNLLRVAVVVNRSTQSIVELLQQVELDVIQLHGDESPDDVAALRDRVAKPVIRAVKLPRGSLEIEEIQRQVEPWTATGCHVLLDADAGSQHGGSGKTLDWPSIARWAGAFPDVHWTLAGGLNADNVAEAVSITATRSVDTASGVEQVRGEKDANLIAAFCQASRLC